MAGYIRQDTTNNIADGNVINASDFDNEYNAIEAAFNATTGHTHDGTSAEGAAITKIGPTQDVVASASALTPKTDNTVDLGSVTLEYKDLFIDGTANIDSLVADTADINAGTIDGVTIGGASAGAGTFTALTTSSTVTLNGGTANGVLYLNGSKVATSGSALTFDGTNLGVGGVSNTYSGYTVLTLNSALNGPIFDLNYAGTRQATFIALTNEARIGSIANIPFTFYQNGTEQMRLTSTGLGIGTSSPVSRFAVSNGTNRGEISPAASNVTVQALNEARTATTELLSAGSILTYWTGAAGSQSEKMRLDSSGNLGLGVTPSAWDTATFRTLQVGSGIGSVSLSGRTDGGKDLVLGSNIYFGTGNFRYVGTGVATSYRQDNAQHTWYTAPSGTAGDPISFTQAMTLDASGNLAVGSTSTTNAKVFSYINDGSLPSIVARQDGAAPIQTWQGASGSERARITSGGDLMVGDTANSAAARFYVKGSGATSGSVAMVVRNSTPTDLLYIRNDGYTGFGLNATAMTLDASGNFLVGGTSALVSAAGRGNITVNGSTDSVLAFGSAGSNIGYLYGTTSGMELASIGGTFVRFTTNGNERARITSGGDLLVGTTSASDVTSGSVNAKAFNNSVGYCLDSSRVGTTDVSHHRFYNGNGQVGSINTSGSATSYNTSSDYRLKDNPQPLTGSGAFIDALEPKTWDWKTDGTRGVGFIAHEVQAVSPGSVAGEKDAVDEDGKPVMQAMEYGSAEFIANIIAELKSLRARVAALETP